MASQSAMAGSLAYWPAAIPLQMCRGCETSVHHVGGSTTPPRAVSESVRTLCSRINARDRGASCELSSDRVHLSKVRAPDYQDSSWVSTDGAILNKLDTQGIYAYFNCPSPCAVRMHS